MSWQQQSYEQEGPATRPPPRKPPRKRPRKPPPPPPPRFPAFTADSPVATRVDPAAICDMDRVGSKASATLRTRLPAEITQVVIHSIAGHFAHQMKVWTGRELPVACFKPHYAVRGDGADIPQIVPELNVPRHANASNGNTIGIEHDGFASDQVSYNEALYVASSRLTRDICMRRAIPMDRTGIIGHEEALGNVHGDPGGYWDWDYYIALVNWNGNPATKPTRVIVDLDSGGLLRRPAWREMRVPRAPKLDVPSPRHSWASRILRTAPARTEQPATFSATVPAAGTWELSLWWPVLPSNNPSAGVTVHAGPGSPPLLTRRVDQRTKVGRSRKTRGHDQVPLWFSLGTLTLPAGTIFVDVSRVSPKRGAIVADALRLFKR
jgi:hypothetical protein